MEIYSLQEYQKEKVASHSFSQCMDEYFQIYNIAPYLSLHQVPVVIHVNIMQVARDIAELCIQIGKKAPLLNPRD